MNLKKIWSEKLIEKLLLFTLILWLSLSIYNNLKNVEKSFRAGETIMCESPDGISGEIHVNAKKWNLEGTDFVNKDSGTKISKYLCRVKE